MRKVFMYPTPTTAATNPAAGIPQTILNLKHWLPSFGWEIAESIENADLIAHHAGDGKGQADIAHVHGLYPNGEPGFPLENWHTEINSRVIESVRTAKAVTVPSQWVADLFRRDMHIDPHVIAWGVNPDEWKHNYQNEGYVLWNKNRVEGVCTPEWVNRLAKSLPEQTFITTFGEANLKNVTVTGILSHNQMRYFIQRAAVYLATTKETGDIGSREALASGVPVLGFRHGALPDFVTHGYNGFLAEPGDEQGLIAGLHWVLKHRETLSKNAIESMKDCGWDKVASQIANVYNKVFRESQDARSMFISSELYMVK